MKQLVADYREMISEQFEYRELLARMVNRDLLLRYKQAVMGFGWAVFMPLLNTAVFSVIFMRVAPIDTGMPYPLFAYCGLLAWNFSASSLRFAVMSLTSNASLVTKIYFPREIFPFTAVLVSLVDLAVGSLVLIGLMIYYSTGVSPTLWLLPIVLLVHVSFNAGCALLVSMANLFYRDVKYLFEIVVAIWMFATAVLYPVRLVGGRLEQLMLLNPMTPIIEAYRDVILRGENPLNVAFMGAAAASVLVFGGGWLIFHRAEFRFAESI